ncbi:hypothetical protein [Geminocystis sp. NIES-3709]|uniref:hypothetical protein n=1 Tax=Geminocystis sp. NIES-3709 TaxID=1617448 RepID=UPI0005FC76C0|nr:hypothetical protein [Geminocystis sp. NIES-3709]BAQ65497.1 hypothetical protein GM3709_2262 [Geminocystis sp. NIES-3709]
MGLKKKVFASKAEQQNYYKIIRTWGKKFKVYHNIPFLNIFTIDDVILTEQDKNNLKKTSIDYIICNNFEEPILCIEFDGFCEGVNKNLEYKPSRQIGDWKDDWRKKIIELKLKVADHSNFPFFVVSSKEFSDLDENIPLTIIDGIIGSLASSNLARERFYQYMKDPNIFEFNENEIQLHENIKNTIPPKNPTTWYTFFLSAMEASEDPIRKQTYEMQTGIDFSCIAEFHIHKNLSFEEMLTHPIYAKDKNYFKDCFPNGLVKGTVVMYILKNNKCYATNIGIHDFQSQDFSKYDMESKIAHLITVNKIIKTNH